MNTKIKVDIRDADLRKDLDSLLKDMDAVRAESIAKGTPQHPKEYQKLAYRMSTVFKGLYSEQWDPRINAIEQAATENPLLQNYDRFQAHYWKDNKDGKVFLENLAQLAMDFFVPADFVALFAQNAEYHLLQTLNLLDGNRAAPLQDGISLGEFVSLEEMQDPLKVVQAYQRLGHPRAVFKLSNAEKAAGNLIKLGYDARLDGQKVVVNYSPPGVDTFLKAAFGYNEVHQQGELYLAAVNHKEHHVLLKNGLRCAIDREDTFGSAAKTKTGAIEVHKDKRWGYFNETGKPFFERFFEERLTEGLAEKIAGLESKVGRDKTEWLINSGVPLESISELPSKGVELVYAAEVKPSLTLLTQAENIAAKIDDFSSFVRAYNSIQAVELPGQKTFWEMLDQLSEEAVSYIVADLVQAQKTHGAKLPQLMQAYQERRMTHKNAETLLSSAIDYILTVKEGI